MYLVQSNSNINNLQKHEENKKDQNQTINTESGAEFVSLANGIFIIFCCHLVLKVAQKLAKKKKERKKEGIESLVRSAHGERRVMTQCE